MTLSATLASKAQVAALIEEFVGVLNAKEVARRAAENETAAAKGESQKTFGYSAEQYEHYSVDAGPARKYVRIVGDTGGQYGRSVECFVDINTGDVLKAAGWKAPAKGVRFNLLDEESKQALYEACGFANGYLYLKR